MSHSTEDRCTSALAYWRYAHEYVRAAQGLRARHHLTCAEMQPLYHLAAQALEFGFKGFLRARGVPAREVLHTHTHALGTSLAAAIAHGLPQPSTELRAAVRLLAPHLRPEAFVALRETDREDVPDLEALFEAVHWLLDAIVPEVAADYTNHYAGSGSPSTAAFVVRLRADLSASRSTAEPLPA